MNYKKLANSFNKYINDAIYELNFLPDEAAGYALEEFSLYMEKYPNSKPLILTIWGMYLLDHNILSHMKEDDCFIDEISSCYNINNLMDVKKILSEEDYNAFEKDMNQIKKVLDL